MTRWLAACVLVAAGGFFLGSPAAVGLQECQGENCTRISVGSGSGAPGSTVTVPITFTQGPDDGQPGEGIDEIAAVAFTLGIPGTGTGTPLQIDCADDDGDGVPDGVTVGEAIGDRFRVVVENFACSNRNRCLCPAEEGQARDDFINIAIYGPKDLPDEGPVEIPVLPSGTLITVGLQVQPGASGEIPLTIYSESGVATKPQFGAYFSQGDKAAVDQTADREADRSKVRVENGTLTVESACVGDCSGDGNVTVDELVKGVNIALGSAPVGECSAFDRDKNGEVTVDELVAGVNNALSGCPSA